jgi:dihydropteroate synthase
MKGTPDTMQQDANYEHLRIELTQYFAHKIYTLQEFGVNDFILDPGFGFGKTTAHNYELLNHLDEFQLFDLPILVGMSRKSMIYKTLGITPEESLNGTTAANVIAMMKGANILRVHDVKSCVEAVKIFNTMNIHL